MKRAINKALLTAALCAGACLQATASSHREAPLIAQDPQADNTDVYAFKSPTDSTKIIIICNYIPFQLPNGGPNYYQFGQNIRYEVHIKNSASTFGDDITYRFTFNQTNQDTTTFFNIRLGKENLKTTYVCQKLLANGTPNTIVAAGEVPAYNIGPRSIDLAPTGLGVGSYDSLMRRAITTATTGERVFAGPIDDPFFVDLGGAFDLGGFRQPGRDGLAKYNVSTIALEIPITNLQKTGQPVSAATSILDPNYVIGVWASASRQQITTLSTTGAQPGTSGPFIQISRLGMPLMNEAVNPIGAKDRWNANNNSTANGGINDAAYAKYLNNPELALYMDASQYGNAVPGLFNSLKIQSASNPNSGLPMFDFRNGKKGLWPVRSLPAAAVAGTAFDPALGYVNILIPDSTSPRAADIQPIFLTGVPNLPPYQLATSSKISGGQINPLLAGKPFINNFMPTLTDMLRLNMAVPATPRTSPDFSSLGLIKAAALGLTDTRFNGSSAVQNIPNMDGFPNGRRLEDDVTTIELQAVGGLVLAAIGLPFDDYVNGSGTIATSRLVSELTFTAGPTQNDTTFKTAFPFVQQPWRGFNGASYSGPPLGVHDLGMSAPLAIMTAYPNPFGAQVSFKYKLAETAAVEIVVIDINGRVVQTIRPGRQSAGEYTTQWNSQGLSAGNYFAQLRIGSSAVQTVKLVKTN